MKMSQAIHGVSVRNSSFELLRIIAIFGIINMHIMGQYLKIVTGANLIYAVITNGVFNTGVTLFMLISGYFGIKREYSKGFKLYSTVMFYSILSFLILALVFNGFTLRGTIKAFLPIETRSFWYITIYFIILLVSPYVNKIVESLSKREYQCLLCVMVYLFYVAPTMLKIEIMRDSGKGLVNLLIIYIIGRYIRIYFDDFRYSKLKLITFASFVMITGMLLNYAYIIKITHGHYAAPFSKDNSIIILIASIAIFLLFKQIAFYSGIVNKISASVFPIYIFEGTLRRFISKYHLFPYQENLWTRATLLILGIMLIVFLLEQLRIKFLGKIEKRLYEKVETFSFGIFQDAKYLFKTGGRFLYQLDCCY